MFEFSKHLSLGICIWWWPFNPISFATKVFDFSKCHSLWIYIRRQSFIPISFVSNVFEFSKHLPLGICIWQRSFYPISFASLIFEITLSLRIYIRRRLFNPNSFGLKSTSFHNTSVSGFIFGSGCLILYLLPPNNWSFQKCLSLRIYVPQSSLIQYLLPQI